MAVSVIPGSGACLIATGGPPPPRPRFAGHSAALHPAFGIYNVVTYLYAGMHRTRAEFFNDFFAHARARGDRRLIQRQSLAAAYIRRDELFPGEALYFSA